MSFLTKTSCVYFLFSKGVVLFFFPDKINVSKTNIQIQHFKKKACGSENFHIRQTYILQKHFLILFNLFCSYEFTDYNMSDVYLTENKKC